MTPKEEIIEGNKIIAKYLGYTYYGHEEAKHGPGWKLSDNKKDILKITHIGEIGKRNYLCRNHNEMRFYNSWDWLMPVLEVKGNSFWLFILPKTINRCMDHNELRKFIWENIVEYLKEKQNGKSTH